MSAGDALGIFLLLLIVGFIVAFFYMVFLQRRAVATQSKAVAQIGYPQRLTELQEQSEQRQLRALQIAEENLVLQREHNELLRELLARLIDGAPAEGP